MEYILLAVIVGAVLTISISYLIINKKSNQEMAKYKANIDATLGEYTSLEQELSRVKENLAQVKSDFYNNEQDLERIKNETKELQALKTDEARLLESISENTEIINRNNEEKERLASDIANINAKIKSLMGTIDLYSRLDEFTSVGHFETPEYLYETSARFSEEIKYVRSQQKELIKNKNAITYPTTLTLVNDKSFNKKILDGQVKLMLSAFNIECDFLIGKVSPSNFARTLERIENLANSIEKSAATLKCGFNISYVELKFEECKLQYQYTLKKKEEIDEQRIIKDQIREEQRAIKEYEQAIAEAEKEERIYRELLNKARQELLKASEDEKAFAEQRIAELEQQLLEAEMKEARAKSMAEQTRKGHVYVISNIGSFGEDVYKIGLTRRLDPMDRVKELGDASVPFSFDVHAMIYSDDAPTLEAALHREFREHRVNAVNFRKEFFQVDLLSIKDAVDNIVDIDTDFKMTALAEDYYESLRLQAIEQVS